MTRLSADSLAQAEKTLKARRAALRQALLGIEAALDAPRDPDWEEAAVEREGDEVLEGLGAQDMNTLRQVEAALERLAAGRYGICTRCGDAIAPARLEALPETPLCAPCAGGSAGGRG